MRKWYPVIPVAGAFLLSFAVYAQLPLRMAVHWDVNGNPNGYSGRLMGAFLLPVMTLAIWGFLRGLPYIDPRRANYAKFQGTYDLMIDLFVTLMALVHVAVVGRALGWPVPDVTRTAPILVGAVTLILGNVLPRARSNWWFGIRTPWTLTSDTVWTKTHRVGGYLLTAAGVITLLSVFLPPRASFVVLMVSICGASLGAVAYSYFAWKKEQP
jgi:immunity protein, SdpI family